MLVAVEGLDQAGKTTQAQDLRDRLRASGYKSRVVSFPDYGTFLGEEIARALQGERDYGPEAMQLLYVANRFERKADIERWDAAGLIVLFDRYVASGIAYGEGQGLDPGWLASIQGSLPQPELTILLDVAPDTTAARKTTGRDQYERDLALLTRVRESYLRQAAHPDWVRVDAEQAPDVVAAEMAAAIEPRLPELR
jgi:dTMP kinase